MNNRSSTNPKLCTDHDAELDELRAELRELRIRLDSLVALVVYTSPHPAAEQLRSDPTFRVTETPAWPRPALQVVHGGGCTR